MNDKWLEFAECEPNKKTRVINVWSKCSQCDIGTIKWHPHWRHYCFFPDGDIILSDRCLQTIAGFITNLNLAHKLIK